jgi:hypothetical protein
MKKTSELRPEAEFNFDFVQLVSRLVAAGFTQKELAYALGVKKGDITKWKKVYPQFNKACKDGKKMAKRFLVAQGLRAAGGYDYNTTRVKEYLDATGNLVKKDIVTTTHHQPPNHNLLMFMLCNIDRNLGDDEFKSRHMMESDIKKSVNIQIGKPESEKICEFAGGLLEETKEVASEVVETKQDEK